MSNTNTTIQVPQVDVSIDIGEHGFSDTTIETNNLATCVCFLVELIRGEKTYAILEHYNYPINEENLSSSEIVLVFLHRIGNFIKEYLPMASIVNENNESEISKASLLISGGDLIEGRNVTNAFSLLTIDNFEPGMYGEEKKMGRCKRIFFKILGVLRNFLDVKKVFTKLLKVGGGCKTLFFHLMIFFLNKNTDFCWEKAKIFKGWGVRIPLHPVVATSLL